MGFLSKPINFLSEVKVQLTKVSWPTKDELIGATVVVIASIFIMSVFIGIIDLIFSRILRYIFR